MVAGHVETKALRVWCPQSSAHASSSCKFVPEMQLGQSPLLLESFRGQEWGNPGAGASPGQMSVLLGSPP